MGYPMIKLKVWSFKTHKKGETLDDCQDANALNEDIGRYAVADGATLSFFPKKWAELLVNRFCHKKDTYLPLEDENWEDWIEPIQHEWLETVSRTVQESKTYMLVDRLSRLESALSTFIGIEFNRDKGEWKASIIGDSCLFHCSGSEFKSYPLQKLEDFPHRPNSFASFPKDNPVGSPPEMYSGKASPCDIFILATDALSKWIIQHREAKNFGILDRLKKIENSEQFDQFVDQARKEEVRLVNDDVTLMFISVEESGLSKDKEETENISSENDTSENVQPMSNLISFLFWMLLIGVFGFVIGFIILVLILLNKN